MKTQWMAESEMSPWNRLFTLCVKSVCVLGALSSLAEAQTIAQRLNCEAKLTANETVRLKSIGDRLVGKSSDGRFAMYVALNDETSCGGLQIFEIAKPGAVDNPYVYKSFCASRAESIELSYPAASNAESVQIGGNLNSQSKDAQLKQVQLNCDRTR